MAPKCIGIILDGNRRWARKKNLPLVHGHKAGYEKLKEAFTWIKDANIKTLIVYAFSTENWDRKPEEVSYLLNLFKNAIKNEINSFKEAGARIRFVGDLKRFPKDLQQSISTVENETKENKEITLVICFSYSGRAEILHASYEIARSERGKEPISEEEFSKHLWTANIPDPDMIIRPGGEKRLSGFLTWQSVYSELFFTDTLWPDFSKQEFENMLSEFANRERRRGK